MLAERETGKLITILHSYSGGGVTKCIFILAVVYRHSITKSKLELSSSDILIVLNNWHSPNRIETSLDDY